jgi:cell shape-determining protein MreD
MILLFRSFVISLFFYFVILFKRRLQILICTSKLLILLFTAYTNSPSFGNEGLMVNCTPFVSERGVGG